jgi:hypothetical protein
MPNGPRGRKAVGRDSVPRGRRCPRCPFYGPSGECRDSTIRSGRCGDWVWYVRDGKQHRRLWINPTDPRTPKQLHWRARLAAASTKYSNSLSDQQVDACIAAGAKLQSRRRLDQSGPLTGQQYWVRQECAQGNAEVRLQKEVAAKPLQTQRISPSIWEHYHGIPIPIPSQCRRTGAHSQRPIRIHLVRGRRSAVENCRDAHHRELWRGS